MPTFIVSEGEDFVVTQVPRGGGSANEVLRFEGVTGITRLNAGKSVISGLPAQLLIQGLPYDPGLPQVSYDTATIRYFFVSPTGDDLLSGYLDAAAGATFAPAQTNQVAIKTLARLRAIFPKFGQGRKAVVLIAPGTYTENLDLTHFVGYDTVIVRGSDLTNSIADKLQVGMVNAFPGPNPDGSWTCIGGTSNATTQVLGTLPADTASAHYRIRFVGDVTPALANVCTTIKMTTAGVITFTSLLTTAHQDGDHFYIEGPGVSVTAIQASGVYASAGATAGLQLAGLRTTTGTFNIRISTMPLDIAGCQQGATSLSVLSAPLAGVIRLSNSYFDETITGRTVGGNRFEGPLQVTNVAGTFSLDHAGFMATSGFALDIRNCPRMLAGSAGANTYARGVALHQNPSGATGGSLSFPHFIFGNAASGTVPTSRIIGANGGGILIDGTCCWIVGIDITNMGALPAISFFGANGATVLLQNVTGSAGNTDVGIDFTTARGVNVFMSSVSVTGTAGDIRHAGSVLNSYTAIGTLGNLVDNANNNVASDVGGFVTAAPAQLVTNQTGTLFGTIVRSNGVSGQVVAAKADVAGTTDGIMGVALNTTTPGQACYVSAAPTQRVRMDSTPTPGQILYLSEANAGQARGTPPANNGTARKKRLGTVLAAPISTSYATVAWNPEILSSVSDGTDYTTGIAQWDPTLCRYYLVDYDAGNDANVGYIDAPAGTVFDPVVASATAFRTLERLLQVFPRVGNNRQCTILIKSRVAGATYQKISGVAVDGLDLTGVAGYAGTLLVRGSTDLTNSVVDRISAGAIQALVGSNSDGSFPVVSGTTTTFTVAGSLGTADTGAGLRWRFTPTTPTVALRNVTGFVSAHSSTVVTAGLALTAPNAGDAVFLEQPGVRIDNFIAPTNQAIQVVGIAWTRSTFTACRVDTTAVGTYAFVEGLTATTFATFATSTAVAGNVTVGRSYTDETGTIQIVGAGLRTVGGVSLTCGVLSFSSSACLSSTAAVTVTSTNPTFGGSGSFFGNGFTVHNVGGVDIQPTVGSTTGSPPTRVVGAGIAVVGGQMRITTINFNTTASVGLRLGTTTSPPERNGFYTLNDLTGTAGNYGIDCTNLRGATVGSIVGAGELVTNQSGATLPVGTLVKANGVAGQVTIAQATGSDDASHVVGVMVTSSLQGRAGYMVSAGSPYVLYDATPTVGGTTYLSPGTAGRATTTVPAAAGSNRRLRVGRTVTAAGSTGRTTWNPEAYPTPGVAPGTP